jgi:hypothetical protein
MYRLGVFKVGIVPDDNLHGMKCKQLFIRMSRCNILLNRNLWFRVVDIKMEQGLL